MMQMIKNMNSNNLKIVILFILLNFMVNVNLPYLHHHDTICHGECHQNNQGINCSIDNSDASDTNPHCLLCKVISESNKTFFASSIIKHINYKLHFEKSSLFISYIYTQLITLSSRAPPIYSVI